MKFNTYLGFHYKVIVQMKRHYIATVIGLLLPGLMVLLYLYVGSDVAPYGVIADNRVEQKWRYDGLPKSKKAIVRMRFSSIPIVYAPENPFTKQLIDVFKRKLITEGGIQLNEDNTPLGLGDEYELIQIFKNKEGLDKTKRGFIGFVFDVDKSSEEPPSKLQYKIRTKDTLLKELYAGTTMRAQDYIFDDDLITMKIFIDEAFMELIGVKESAWTIQPFPIPKDLLFSKMVIPHSSVFSLFLTIVLVVMNMILLSYLIDEKKTGILERFKMVGIPSFSLFFFYALYDVFIGMLSTLLITASMKGYYFLIASNFLLIWMYFLILYMHTSTYLLCFAIFFNSGFFVFIVSLIVLLAPLGLFLYATNPPLVGQVFGALIPSINLCIAADIIASFETIGRPTSFVRTLKSAKYQLPIYGLLIMAFIMMIIAFFIFHYGILVRPGPYGTPKHFYFPVVSFVNKFKDWKKLRSSMVIANHPLLEKMPGNLDVGLRILNLRKKFGSFFAVKDLSFDIYEGQITALLGHNGAGKTTTLSILTGMLAPTSGSVFYDGYDVFTDMNRFREDLGLCPQENMLLNDFTVRENLKLFGLLRGMSCKASSVSAVSSMELVNLLDKRGNLVKTLSGGMKRRLCLALALVGEPKILILDEPTSGLDPQSRREVWDLLLSLREGRIMILTTHFMEEADTLGDMIAIIDHGELQCYGTSMFLKKHFGAGYQITVYCKDQTRFNEIISTVTSQIPSANVRLVTDDFIVFHAPSKHSTEMIRMYEKLEGTKYISRVGISSSTMDDVFLKVREEVDKKTKTDDTEKQSYYEDVVAIRIHSSNFIFEFFQRFSALFLKNIQYLRNWLPLLVSVLLILLMSYLAVTALEGFIRGHTFKLNVNLNIYGPTDVYIFAEEFPELREGLKEVLKAGNHRVEEKIKEKDPSNALLKISETDPETYWTTMIVAVDLSNKIEPKLWYNLAAMHSAPIAINLFSNALIRASGKDNSISTIFEPLLSKEDCNLLMAKTSAIIIVRWFPFILVLAIVLNSLRVRNLHDERTSLFKHLQLMAGASTLTYWLSFFILDLLIYGVLMGLMFVMFLNFDSFGLFTVEDITGSTALTIILYGITKYWMIYAVSFLCRTSNGAMLLLILLDVIGLLAYFLAWLVSKGINIFMDMPPDPPSTMGTLQYTFYIIEFILALLPTNSFFAALIPIQSTALAGFTHRMCPKKRHSFFRIPSIFGIERKPESIWSKIAKPFAYLGCLTIFFILLVLLLDWKVFEFLWVCLWSAYRRRRKRNETKVTFVLEEVEPDVAQERENVQEAIRNLEERRWSLDSESPRRSKKRRPPMIAQGLKKVYDISFTAVNDVSFVLEKGECFGLLGTNGAGKSTTFGMLAGVIVPSDGRTYIKGKEFTSHRKWCLSQLGYCPQGNSLAGILTARQSLTLFAHLRLAHPKFIKRQVNGWMNILGLEEYADRRCGTYSGGNKRKLCTAMALINSPAVILLDEPTSGIDPVARRNLWTALRNYINPDVRSSRRVSGIWKYPTPSILLSSHSMDECEALCHRLAIMTKGDMRCLGTMGRLRDLYGKGFVILIKLNLSNRHEDDLYKLQDRMDQIFNHEASLKEERAMLLRYHINDRSSSLSAVFNKMERIKSDFAIVEDYSISDLSLEYVFLFFANEKRKSRFERFSLLQQEKRNQSKLSRKFS